MISKVNLGINRIELSEQHSKLANFNDCKEVHLSPQLMLGVTDTPKVKMERVANYSGKGWEVAGNDSRK